MTESQKDEETPTDYPLDASGNRAGTGYTLTGLHAYSATPQGTFSYSVSGRLTDRDFVNEEFRYDAQGRLLEHWIVGTTLHDDMGGEIALQTPRGDTYRGARCVDQEWSTPFGGK